MTTQLNVKAGNNTSRQGLTFLSTVHVMSNKRLCHIHYRLNLRLVLAVMYLLHNGGNGGPYFTLLVSVFSVSLRNTVVAVVIAFTKQELDTPFLLSEKQHSFTEHPRLSH